jgi:hypothetical protein
MLMGETPAIQIAGAAPLVRTLRFKVHPSLCRWLNRLLKNGKQVEWGRYAVSADGKTMHATEVGTDETGAKYKWTEVWERQ